jgi:hypothetical protein
MSDLKTTLAKGVKARIREARIEIRALEREIEEAERYLDTIQPRTRPSSNGDAPERRGTRAGASNRSDEEVLADPYPREGSGSYTAWQTMRDWIQKGEAPESFRFGDLKEPQHFGSRFSDTLLWKAITSCRKEGLLDRGRNGRAGYVYRPRGEHYAATIVAGEGVREAA